MIWLLGCCLLKSLYVHRRRFPNAGAGGCAPAFFLSHLCRRHRQPSIIIISFLSPLVLSTPSKISPSNVEFALSGCLSVSIFNEFNFDGFDSVLDLLFLFLAISVSTFSVQFRCQSSTNSISVVFLLDLLSLFDDRRHFGKIFDLL